MQRRQFSMGLGAASLLGMGISENALAQQAPQGVTATEIKIGATMGVTGAAALPAQGYRAAVEAAIAEVNEAGGINGRKFQFVVFDDGFDIQRSVANIRRLVDSEKVYAMTVCTGSPNLPASWPFLKSKGIPMFAPTLPPDPRQQNVFMLGTGHFDQARVIVDFLASKGVKSVAVFRQDTDLGKAIEDGVKKQIPGSGITLATTVVTEIQGTDLSSAVQKARDANPDAVVLGTDPTQSTLILQAMGKIGWAPVIMGNSSTISTGSTATVGPAGKAAAGSYGTIVAEPPTSTAAGVVAWRNAIIKHRPAFNKPEFVPGQLGYSAMQVFFEIIRRMGNDFAWTNFINTAESLRGFETNSLPPVTYGKDFESGGHMGTRGAIVQQWDGTKWTRLTTGFIQPINR